MGRAALTRCNDIIVPIASHRRRYGGGRGRHPWEAPGHRGGSVCETPSGAGLANGGEKVDPVRKAEVFVAVPGLVGEKDVGGTDAQLCGTAADTLRPRDGTRPDESEGADAVRAEVSSATAASSR